MKFKLKPTILLMIYLPVVGILAITMLVTSSKTKKLMAEENEKTLTAAVQTMKFAYDTCDEGQYRMAANGEVYKGEYCISGNSKMVDDIADKSGCVATFFWGDKRVMTSVKDTEGKRMVGTTLDNQEIFDAVLGKGEVHFVKDTVIGGAKYYAVYAPVYQEGSQTEIVGMVFMGLGSESTGKAVFSMINAILSIAFFITIGVSFSSIYFTNSIAKSARSIANELGTIAEGDFSVTTDAKALKRVDEIGDMGRATEDMLIKIRESLNIVVTNSNNLATTSETLDKMADETARTIGSVENAVNDIAAGATSQAGDTTKASQNVMDMGEIINGTVSDVDNLTATADKMADSGKTAMDILAELKEVNERAIKAIDTVYEQTNITNESARKIHEATDIIASIAEETNLLSLNASIEAARAGDAGRGFAVVADQIQKLAEQSNNSAQEIENITMSLMEDSDKSVEIMKEVKEIMTLQSDKMNTTGDAFNVVSEGIDGTKEGIDQITERAKKLDQARNEIVDIIQSLTAIAEQNAASTEETSAATAEVAAAADSVSKSAGDLKGISKAIQDSVCNFKF